MLRKERLVKWLLVIVWMGVIFLFSAQPADQIRDFGIWNIPIKKGAHMVGYAVLAILAQRSIGGTVTGRSWWYAMGLVLLYAISDEYHQTFVAGRTGQALDVVIDCVGAVVGLLVHRQRSRLGLLGELLRLQ